MSVRQSKRTIKERLISAAVAGDDLKRAVLKATDSESRAPKPKHVETLLYATHLMDVPVQDTAEGLFHRLEDPSWVVILKTLVVFHRMFRDGHERFVQYVVTRSRYFELEDFLDERTDGPMMSLFVRHYAKYLNEKLVFYRHHGTDFCHIKASKQAEAFTTVAPPQLFKDVAELQALLGVLLEQAVPTNPDAELDGHGRTQYSVRITLNTDKILESPVVQSAYDLLYRDALKIFVCLNDGVVNVLERYFTMSKKEAQESYGIYQLFVTQSSQIDTLLGICRGVGLLEDKNFPELHHAPTMLLPKMAEYLQGLGGTVPEPTKIKTIPRTAVAPAPAVTETLIPDLNPGAPHFLTSTIINDHGTTRMVSSNSPNLPRKSNIQGVPDVLPSEMWKKGGAHAGGQHSHLGAPAASSAFQPPLLDAPAPVSAVTLMQPQPAQTLVQPSHVAQPPPFHAVFDSTPIQPAPAPAPAKILAAANPFNPFLDD